MRLRLGLLTLVLAFALAQMPVNAQQPVAAVVQITYAGVQLQRANTQNWLPLPADAQAPFGIGDILRTDKTGRAFITFADASHTLLLPGTEYQLKGFDQTDKQQVNISLRLLKGRSIQLITDPAKIASYQLDLQHMTLTQPTQLFATQVQPDNSSDVIVAQGSLNVGKADATVDLQAGSGLRAMDTLGEVIPITAPNGFSFLSVTSKTCRGIANATIPGEESVAVRIGPGEDYLNLGNIPNGSQITIVGKADTGKRYLTPFLSNFGPVIANGINVESCDTIPIVPAEAQPINGVTNPSPFEMDFLTPFLECLHKMSNSISTNKLTRILLIDDDADDYIMVRDMINAMPKGKFQLEWQADFNDALPIMKKLEHDVYIVDYVLGTQNGLDLIRAAFPNGCTVPIILLTARGRRDIDEEALALGVAEYFDKADIRLPLLERAIRYAINNKRIENDLRKSETLFRSLIQSAADYIQVLDLQGNITRTNPATLRNAGYAEADMVGHPFVEFLSSPSKALIEKQFPIILQQEDSRQEIEFLHKDGSIRHMDCSWSVVRNGESQYVVVIQRDVTDRKRAEEALQESLVREKEMSELKSRFVSIASHELRTPLSTIQNNIYMLKNYAHKLDDAAREGKLDKIQLMVEHITELLQDVLSLNNMETGRVEFNPTPIRLDTFFRDIAEEFQNQKDRNHTIQIECKQPLKATVDSRMMRQIITNLLDNAIKYSKAGTTINVELSSESDKVVLKVSDQGIGIPEGDQAKMFQPFRRASNVGDTIGSGLGLSIIKQAVDLHRGTITFNSKLGEGTTFIVTIPAIESAPA